MTILITLSIIATISIIAGVIMGQGKSKIEPMPVAKYQKYAGTNVNHFGEN